MCSYEEGLWAWILEDIVRVAGPPMKGQLGLFDCAWPPEEGWSRLRGGTGATHGQ